MLWIALLLACTSDEPARTPVDDTDLDTDVEDTDDTDVEDTDGYDTCHGTPGAADRDRTVVAGFPFAGDGDEYGLFTLDTAGVLTDTTTRFTMGPGLERTIAFTPDGQIGIAVQEDGTLGVFRLEDDGVVVVHEGFGQSDFYAEDVVIHPDGEQVWVVDNNWRNNGGGIYALSMDCDGTLTTDGRILEGKQPKGLRLDDDGVGLVFSRDLAGSAAGDNLHLVDLDTPELLGSGPVFPDDEAIASTTLWTHDGRLGLVGDNAAFTSLPNRIGVAVIDGTTVTAVQSIEVEDPFALAESPHDDSVLVVSGFGDALYRMARDGDGYGDPVEISYSGGGPELPGAVAMVERGSLSGHVLVAEVSGIRQLQFESAGGVTDHGRVTTGGTDGIVGAIGVQP